jgi:DNA end-binding protein Ku
MEAAIKSHVSAKLAPAELQDEYAQRVLELVKKKERKDEDVVPAPAEPADEEEVSVIDLMEVLKRSLEGGGAGRKTRKTARKRKTA